MNCSLHHQQASAPPHPGGDSARVMAPLWLTLSFITEAEGRGAPMCQMKVIAEAS